MEIQGYLLNIYPYALYSILQLSVHNFDELENYIGYDQHASTIMQSS
jgi:hypothetical protein